MMKFNSLDIIETGMRIELRDGTTYVVIHFADGVKFCKQNEVYPHPKKHWDRSLKHSNSGLYDIVKVGKPADYKFLSQLDSPIKDDEILWSEEKEMEEIKNTINDIVDNNTNTKTIVEKLMELIKEIKDKLMEENNE